MSSRTLALLACVAVGVAFLASATLSAANKTQICLAPPVAQIPANSVGDAGAAVTETLTSFLSGPSLTVMPLTARLASQAREEAQQHKCQYVLFTTVKYKRKTTGLFSRIAAGAVQNGALQAAAVSTTSGGRVLAGATAGGAANMAVAGQVMSRDELALDYRLEDGAGKTLVAKSDKKRASSDGEDLITPLIAGASETIAAALHPAPVSSK